MKISEIIKNTKINEAQQEVLGKKRQELMAQIHDIDRQIHDETPAKGWDHEARLYSSVSIGRWQLLIEASLLRTGYMDVNGDNGKFKPYINVYFYDKQNVENNKSELLWNLAIFPLLSATDLQELASVRRKIAAWEHNDAEWPFPTITQEDFSARQDQLMGLD